jgi:serine/threonine protein kinase
MVQEEGIPDSGRDSSLEETHKLPRAAMDGLLRAGATETTRALRRWVPPLAEEVQRALPQYEVTGFIARGGMGAVYKGVQKALKRDVAIKMLPAEIVDDDLDFVGRFRREAQAMASLSHPNIVTVFEAGETPEGLLYFVMEYIDGTDVGELVAEQVRLPQEEALRITSAVLAALECAHGRGIIHRDIKPSNVLINKQGEVKVADFGLAKVAAADGGLTQSVVTVGTPDFLAPETYIAGFPLDQRADIYSTGVMLYKMLTGRVPRGRFDAPSGEVRGMDPRLDRIIDKAMQEDREKRYGTAKEMRLEVEEALSKPMSQAEASVFPGSKSPVAPAARGTRGWSRPRLASRQLASSCGGVGILAFLRSKEQMQCLPWQRRTRQRANHGSTFFGRTLPQNFSSRASRNPVPMAFG